MNDVIDVAEYMLNYCENDLGEAITNLQLQKFLYYVQGIKLAIDEVPMFMNNIEAWRYGPVVPDAYYWFNDNLSNPIENVEISNDVLSKSDKSIIKNVAKQLIRITPWELVEKTHSESPWINNYIPNFNQIIPDEDIKEWFKKNVIRR
ncbi:DUF4065 domain-containing protein [Clostridium baratii]